MTEISLPIGNVKYQEDISVLAAGTEIIAGPATIWTLTVDQEANTTCVVNFSDSDTSYNNTYREFKVVLDGPGTYHYTFPKGWTVSAGLCAVSNAGSIDISVTYD